MKKNKTAVHLFLYGKTYIRTKIKKTSEDTRSIKPQSIERETGSKLGVCQGSISAYADFFLLTGLCGYHPEKIPRHLNGAGAIQ